MKLKSLFLLMVITVMILSGCSAGDDMSAPDGMKLFSNEHSEFTAYIPAAWTSEVSTGVLSARVPATNGPDASNVTITAQTLEADIATLDDYWKGYEEDFKATFGDMEYVGEHPTTTTLSGEAANKYVYTATVTGTTYQFMQMVCIKERTVYVITYTSTPELYDSNIEDVDKILDNFTFNDK